MNYNNPCGCGCPTPPEMFCNNIVKKCYVEEVPHVVNYNTHVINECVKKHITVPKYTCSEETVVIDEYQTMPMQQPTPFQFQPIMEQPMQQPMMNNGQVMPNYQMPNMFNPFQF